MKWAGGVGPGAGIGTPPPPARRLGRDRWDRRLRLRKRLVRERARDVQLPPRQHDHDAAGDPRGRDDAAVARDVDQLPRQAAADNAGLRDRVLAERQVARAGARRRLGLTWRGRLGALWELRRPPGAGPPTSHSILAVPPSVMPRTVIAPSGREHVRERAQRTARGAQHGVGDDAPARLRHAVAADAPRGATAGPRRGQALADHVGAGLRERRRPGGWIARRGGRDPWRVGFLPDRPAEERERACRARSSLRDHQRAADVALVDVGARDGVTGRQRGSPPSPRDGGRYSWRACWYRRGTAAASLRGRARSPATAPTSGSSRARMNVMLAAALFFTPAELAGRVVGDVRHDRRKSWRVGPVADRRPPLRMMIVPDVGGGVT